MNKYLSIFLVFVVIFAFSCGSKNTNKPNYPKRPKVDVPATKVVSNFLDALINEDFEEAYENIYILSSDKEGYVLRMKNLSEQTGTKLVNYKILATQLYKDTAIIVAELKIVQRSIDSHSEDRITRNKYDLALIEEKWKITKDTCIENCK